jgi:site-specific DNA-cytosine methylase
MLRKIRMVDVFCGTKSMASVFEENGHGTLTIDWDTQHNPDICDNVLNITAKDVLDFHGWDTVDYVHMSPDCTTYSVAACSTHRNIDRTAKSEKAANADKVLTHILKLLEDLNPKYFTIENPRGIMRKMPEMIAIGEKYRRDTITYCQYGDTRMKPTDIWNNLPMVFRPMCKNGASCHEPAPRGSSTGTQGVKGSVLRSKIPIEFCMDVCRAIEKDMEE